MVVVLVVDVYGCFPAKSLEENFVDHRHSKTRDRSRQFDSVFESQKHRGNGRMMRLTSLWNRIASLRSNFRVRWWSHNIIDSVYMILLDQNSTATISNSCTKLSHRVNHNIPMGSLKKVVSNDI